MSLESTLTRSIKFSITLFLSVLMPTQIVFASDLDALFNPDADRSVATLAMQADGKILVGGNFTSMDDTTRNRIARLEVDGSLDAGFNPDVNVSVTSIAIQSNNKILIGGVFTTVGDTERRRIARLEEDGTLDDTFNANLEGQSIQAIAIQEDGKILIGGTFTMVGGSLRNNIARLNTDGSLDGDFDPNVNDFVSAIAVQDDGQILIGGGFTSVNGSGNLSGTLRNRIARLDPDGALDTGFNPNADNTVRAITVQVDEKILIGGAFSTVGGLTRNRIARLLATNGTPDDFNSDIEGTVESMAVQADGRILVSGQFISVGSVSRSRIARLETDGTLDTAYATGIGALGFVFSIVPQTDGKAVVGGFFDTVSGIARNNIARITSEPAQQSVNTSVDGSSVSWQRGGTAPELSRTTLETSSDGTNWTTPVNGRRISGGWQFQGLSIQTGVATTLRLRGVYRSSRSITETVQLSVVSENNDELCIPIKAVNNAIGVICL